MTTDGGWQAKALLAWEEELECRKAQLCLLLSDTFGINVTPWDIAVHHDEIPFVIVDGIYFWWSHARPEGAVGVSRRDGDYSLTASSLVELGHILARGYVV